MKTKIISLKAATYERMYKSYYSDLNNYNRAKCMAGNPPVSMITFKSKIS